MNRRGYLLMLVVAASAAVSLSDVTAQVFAPDAEAVRKRLEAVEQRLARTEAENAALRGKLEAIEAGRAPAGATRSPAELEAAIDRAVEARDKEDVVTWDRLVKSNSPIEIYGFLRLDAYYNSARANSAITPVYVLPENGIAAKPNDDSFAFDARLTRLGLNIRPGAVAGADVLGKLEIDFANFPQGSPESRETPRIRLAYADLDFGDVTLRFGQDWDVISPYIPSANSETLMWYAGNLGDRRPQARVTYERNPHEDLRLRLSAALGMTGAVDDMDLDTTVTPPTYTSSERDGFDSGLPHLQMRGEMKTGGLTLGVWGHVAALETDTSFPVATGGTTHFRSQSLGVDWLVELSPAVQFKGEAWVGQALGDFRGGIAQTINTATGREIHARGGWAEVAVQASDFLRIAAGATVDDPHNGDVPAGGRGRNFTFYVATGHDWGGGFKTGLDVIYWETDWIGAATGNMVRVNVYTQLNF